MLTEAQKKYLETLPTGKIVHIKPWDPKAREVAYRLIQAIKNSDSEVDVIYIGASALGVAGMNDIDFTITSPVYDFHKHIDKLTPVLGPPQKIGKENVRWEGIGYDGYIVDVHMTDPSNPFLQEHMKLFELLKSNPALLKEYSELKEQCDGLDYKEYQTRKYEFYNRVLGIV